MDISCKAESGLQLLARLHLRPDLKGLDAVLFENGPNPNDIIEISGDPSSGKTLMIMQFLVKCLLPSQWLDYSIGGLNAGAVMINTDHHFNLLKLVNLMEAWLVKSAVVPVTSASKLTNLVIEEIIKDSLKRLTILSCHDSTQLFVTFYSLESILSTNTNISLILLDSISAYYWQDTMVGGLQKMDSYLNRILKTSCKCIGEYKVVFIYTKPMYFRSKSSELPNCSNNGQLTHRIILSKIQDVYCASINTRHERKMNTYLIEECGICWCH
ncbi:DNA repair protein XRCC2 [Anabrus simplex]|uniref:DNA repair protein XRCC2 n=1 Tax=Anabrus simplex TaxID=316456 RepID=UPI0035A2F039